MYHNHATQCQDYALQSADNLRDVGLMVALSIQQNWLSVGDQLKDVRSLGAESRFLWGSKAKAYEYLEANKHLLYGRVLAIANSHKDNDAKAFSLMQTYLRVVGLGIPKAGFLAQLSLGLVGCMDSHNIKRYGLNENQFKLNRDPRSLKALESNELKIRNYITLCHDIGTDTLWNNWCDNLSNTSPKWRDGNHVSQVHINYLNGEL